ncbi:hypothetical protein NQ317_017968 [Molorchus minor]|uniref:Eukaryotic translation initiation factor 3 subunit L n=1 Tax=Molorchus minor TaxID=1323400 RepID=A0ABQ9JM70_9CUCU|nr:hypothetical protein NQ317_017968 [Molorchus minor]
MSEEYEQGYDYGYEDYGAPTGDPSLDEFNRQHLRMPEAVQRFLTCFRNYVNEAVARRKQVAALVDSDPVFMILYKELYFRHIYARIQGGPSLGQRFNSFYNYCDLFNYILSAEEPVPLELPDVWLWELIDEFVYQFQSFAQYRARLQKKTPQELETLNSNNKVGDVLCVLNVLLLSCR